MKIEEIMTRRVVTVPPGASLKQVAHLLVEHRISGLLVVDDRGQVLGVVSEADILVKEGAGLQVPRPLAWLIGFDVEVDRSRLEARLVGEAMTSPVLTIEAHRPVSLAARLMSEKGVNRLPVVENGELVGIVTRADLVRAFVRSDAEIGTEIREDLVARDPQLGKRRIQVEVDDGEVTLAGALDGRADVEKLEARVSRVPGVVGVHSKLTWTHDHGSRSVRAAETRR
jgi:CBS domain-containing protein